MNAANKRLADDLRRAVQSINQWWYPNTPHQSEISLIEGVIQQLDPQTDVDDVLDAIRKQSLERREKAELDRLLNASRDED